MEGFMSYKHKYKLGEVFFIDYCERPTKPSEVFHMCGKYKIVGFNKGDSQNDALYLVEKIGCGSDLQPSGFTVYIRESVLDFSEKIGIVAECKTIPKGTFILITDYNEGDRYLKVGEITEVKVETHTDIKYTVVFGTDYKTGYDDIEVYGKELLDKCRILKFETL